MAGSLLRADVSRTIDSIPFTFSGSLDLYYVDDFADTPFPDRQITPSGVSPVYSDSRKDRLAVNQALLAADFATDWVRGDLGVEAGTYVQKNYADEDEVAKDDWTPTRSLMADNTPYYESGAKITWDPNARWEYCLCLLQGWQEIGSKNSNKAIGTQVQFKPVAAVLFNSST